LVQALRDLFDQKLIPHQLDLDIKWPNDVLISGKKCAGILLEALPTDGNDQAVIVGIGINVHQGSVPIELAQEATCIDDRALAVVPRRKLLVSFLHRFQLGFLVFERGEHQDLLESWKTYSSMWNGVPIWLEADDGTRRAAITCGLNETGALLVRTTAGEIETIFAGNVKVRRIPESEIL
jgi:BirA family biotin operon repressor/biotin-[acetyl-CoA-carboxylase] ligase